jgi:hypothetical protein
MKIVACQIRSVEAHFWLGHTSEYLRDEPATQSLLREN